MQVGAFIVGAPRCGTYAWFNYLGQHPQVVASRRKEPNWFCSDMPAIWRVKSLDEYHQLFAAERLPQARVTVEASALYLASTAAPGSIQRYNPAAKIIVLLRPPLDFLRSYHGLLRWLLFEDQPDLATAWGLQQTRRQGLAIPLHCLEPATLQYAAMARFGAQVTRYLAHFPPEQILLIPHETWAGAPRATYLRLMAFLGLDDDGREDFPTINPALAYRSTRLATHLRYPPAWQQSISAAWQTIPGAQRLSLHRRLLHANTGPAPRTPIPADLAQKITAELAADQALLQELLQRQADRR